MYSIDVDGGRTGQENGKTSFLKEKGDILLSIRKKIVENTRHLIILSSRIAGIEGVAFYLLPQKDDGFALVDAIKEEPIKNFSSALIWGIIQKTVPENELDLDKIKDFFVNQGWIDTRAMVAYKDVPQSIRKMDEFFDALLDEAKSVIAQRCGEDAKALIDTFSSLIESQQELLNIEREIVMGYHEAVKRTQDVLELIYESSGMTREVLDAIQRGDPPEAIAEMMQMHKDGEMNG